MTSNESEIWDEQTRYTPNGCQTNSKAPNRFVDGVYPKLVEQGHGGNVVDVNGKVYVDYIAALGAISVGYNNFYINNAIKEQLGKGISFSLPNRLEGQLAKRISELVPSMQMSKFTKTGSDACSMAIKAARAFTGRTDIIAVGYHGWHDWYTISTDKRMGIPEYYGAFIRRCEYGSLLQIDQNLTHSTAAVILEPAVFKPINKNYIENLIAKAHSVGALVIFDETVTGGRFEKLTAQAYLDVKPDLTVLGKGLANGMPLAIVGGSRTVMGVFEQDLFFASTTFGGETLSLAACLATLEVLEKHIPKIIKYGKTIQEGFNFLFAGQATCEGYPTRTQFVFPTAIHKALFWQECVKRGVLFGYSNFPMIEHTEADLNKTLEVMKEASEVVKAHWTNPQLALEGATPVEVFRISGR